MPQATVNNATAILTSVVRTLVSKPERVSLEADYSAHCVALTLRVAPEDVEAVEGPNGRTGRSLRTIVSALAQKSPLAISLEIKAT